MANSFLNMFFEEVENGIDVVMHKSSQKVQDTTARLLQVPSSEHVASKATNLLKSQTHISEEVSKKFNEKLNDENFMKKAFGVATAAMVAVSAYAYIV